VVHRWLHARRPAVARLRARQSKGVGWKDEAASASESLARENAAVAARRETEEEVEETRRASFLKTYVTAKVPSSLHEQIRGCRSGVEPAATLRPTSSPWGGLPPTPGLEGTPPALPPPNIPSQQAAAAAGRLAPSGLDIMAGARFLLQRDGGAVRSGPVAGGAA
jgi:hypothetical protein